MDARIFEPSPPKGAAACSEDRDMSLLNTKGIGSNLAKPVRGKAPSSPLDIRRLLTRLHPEGAKLTVTVPYLAPLSISEAREGQLWSEGHPFPDPLRGKAPKGSEASCEGIRPPKAPCTPLEKGRGGRPSRVRRSPRTRTSEERAAAGRGEPDIDKTPVIHKGGDTDARGVRGRSTTRANPVTQY